VHRVSSSVLENRSDILITEKVKIEGPILIDKNKTNLEIYKLK